MNSEDKSQDQILLDLPMTFLVRFVMCWLRNPVTQNKGPYIKQ